MRTLAFLDVFIDERLRLPPSSRFGANPGKLQRQVFVRFGKSTVGMPPPWVYMVSDGVLWSSPMGATRATCVAKLLPGVLVRVEVIADQKTPVRH